MPWQYESTRATSIYWSTTSSQGQFSTNQATNTAGYFLSQERLTRSSVSNSYIAQDNFAGFTATATTAAPALNPGGTLGSTQVRMSEFGSSSTTWPVSIVGTANMLRASSWHVSFNMTQDAVKGSYASASGSSSTLLSDETFYPGTFTTSYFYSTKNLQDQLSTSTTFNFTGPRGSFGSTWAYSSSEWIGGTTFLTTYGESLASTRAYSYETYGHSQAPGATHTGAAGDPVTSYLTTAVQPATTTSSSASTTVSGILNVPRTRSFNSGTTTSTTATTNTVTTATSSTLTYPVATVSGTTSSATLISCPTTTTVAATNSYTTYGTGTFNNPAIVDTVVEVGTNDWVWHGHSSAGSGRGQVSDVASSLSTGTYTFKASYTTTTTNIQPFSSVHPSSVPETSTAFVTATFGYTSWQSVSLLNYTWTTSSTVSTTYSLAGPTSAADSLSYSAVRTSSVTYLVSTTSSVANLATITRTTNATLNFPSVLGTPTLATTVTFSYSTTSATDEPPYTSSLSYTVQTVPQFTLTQVTFSSTDAFSNTYNTSGVTQGGYTLSMETRTVSYDSLVQLRPTYTSFTTGTSFTGSQTVTSTTYTHTVTEPAAIQGFQAGSSLGRSASANVGTNISAAIVLPMAYPCSSVYNGGPVTPVFATEQRAFGTLTTFADSSTAYSVTTTGTTVGTVATTTTTAQTVNFGTVGSVPETRFSRTVGALTVGGFGWNSTHTTRVQMSAPNGASALGIHRGTSVDSTGGTSTFMQSWHSTRTLGVAPGAVVAFETVPYISRSTTSSNNEASSGNVCATFPAFPST